MKIQILTTPSFVPPAVYPDEMGMPCFDLVDNLRAELPPHYEAHRMSESEWFSFILGTVVSIPCNLIASYLYDLLKSKQATKIVVNGITLEGDKETIEKILNDVVQQTKS